MADHDPLAFLDQPRDERGRYASTPEPAPAAAPPPAQETKTEPVPAAEPAALPAPIEPAPKAEPVIPPGYVPLAAQLDERDKRQALQRELEDLKRQFEAAKKPAEPLDPITDPDGWAKNFDGKLERAAQDVLFNTTRRFAVRDHTEEVVKKVEEWAEGQIKANPALYRQIVSQPDPYEFMVAQYKRDQAMTEVGPDPAAFAKKWAEANGYVLKDQGSQPAAPAAAPPPQPAAPLPKPSLATAPAASGSAPKGPTGPGAAFESVFK